MIELASPAVRAWALTSFTAPRLLYPAGRDRAVTDADELEAELKRAMIAQSEESVLLLDDSKLGARGQNAIARVTEVSSVLVHGSPPAALEPLRATGVRLRVVGG